MPVKLRAHFKAPRIGMELDAIPALVEDVKRVHAQIVKRGGKLPKKLWTRITSAIPLPPYEAEIHTSLKLKYAVTIEKDGSFYVLMTKEAEKVVDSYN